MNQLQNLAGTARELVHLTHEAAAGSGVAPLPTIILLGLVALFALVGMVAGGRGRLPRGAHRA